MVWQIELSISLNPPTIISDFYDRTHIISQVMRPKKLPFGIFLICAVNPVAVKGLWAICFVILQSEKIIWWKL